jgi:6-phosphogluconolactonase/glucosamine-6-phosphate isomerase/deaminase
MSTRSSAEKIINRREAGNNVWLGYASDSDTKPSRASKQAFEFEVLETEAAVGQAMLDELVAYAREKAGDIVIVLLGGRGAQAMYKIINERAPTGELDALLGRLHVFTQDALAPMRMNNGLSFVRDFERLLGDEFFQKIKSFTPMNTETGDLEGELIKYLEKLENLGGIDIFFLGLGPEAKAASHLAYIKPDSGARFGDVAGIIPISESILEHHINKFKVGGSEISEADETECRHATHILTLGPAAILGAKKIVQSIVDASTAPAKRASFKRLIETELSENENELARQLDENPGLWIRLHRNVRSLILPDVLSEPPAAAGG